MKRGTCQRRWGTVVLFLLVISLFFPKVSIQAATTLKLVYGGKNVNYTKSQVAFTLDGKNINLNSTPGILIKDTSMGYYKDIFKTGLNATCKYDSSTKKLTITKFDRTIVMTLNSKTAYVNGKKKKMGVPMQKVKFVKAGVTRIMVPVRFVAENLGYTYTWSSSKKAGVMKRNWVELYMNGSWSKYTGTKAKASVDGKAVNLGNMPGIVIDGTAYLNGKKVFGSAIGGTCVYDSTEQTITVEKDDNTVVFRLGTNTALVNGVETEISTQAVRVKNRATGKYYLMVPGRFTANSLGYDYNWNNSTKTSQITKKVDENETPSVTPSATPSETPSENIDPSTVSGAAISFTLPDGVTSADIQHADYYYKNQFCVLISGDYVSYFENNPISINGSTISGYTVTLTSAGKTRLLFNTTKLQGYKVHIQEGLTWIEVGDPKDIFENIVVLDCGHGGSDPGAQAGGYQEKNITYSILYTYAKKYFDSDTSNIKAYWSRYDDTFVTLSDRAAFASKVGADLFISLHMNSATNTSATGTEVYYSTSNNKKQSNGLTSKIMADMFQSKLVDVMGTTSRGVKTANYTVIYKNTVPAVLIELGFISNSSDRAKLTDSSYQKAAAEGIYQTTESIFSSYPTGR